MKIRLLLAAVCILALPMWLSISEGDKLNNSAPFATVAFAGHTLGGYWCSPCGTGGCLCDPGEQPDGQSAQPVSDASPIKRGGKAKMSRGFDLDFGAGAFLLGLGLFMWSRFRA